MSLITKFAKTLSGTPVPERFKRWCGIAMVAGVLERRVWVDVGVGPIYPNMFILLVAPPGTGKSIPIDRVRRVWRKAADGRLHVAPDNFTKAAFLDKLAVSSREFENPVTGELEIYHSLLVASTEFGNFLPAHDTAFLNVLNDIYDAGESYEEERRSSNSVKIGKPIVTIIGGTQPDFLGALLPDEAWGMGFTSRLVLVYEGTKTKPKLIQAGKQKTKAEIDELAKALDPLATISGFVEWSDDAWNELNKWFYDKDEEPKPTHPRLRHYCSRRMVTLCKLSTVAALDKRPELLIEKEHFEEALFWLEEAESVMPEIFKDMTGQVEFDIIADIHHWIWDQYARKDNTPVPLRFIYQVAQKRLPAHKVEFVIELMIKSELIKKTPKGVVPLEWKEIEL